LGVHKKDGNLFNSKTNFLSFSNRKSNIKSCTVNLFVVALENKWFTPHQYASCVTFGATFPVESREWFVIGADPILFAVAIQVTQKEVQQERLAFAKRTGYRHNTHLPETKKQTSKTINKLKCFFFRLSNKLFYISLLDD
jgi:hypothetical protein